MFNIIISDLDGTLLSTNHKVTPFTKKILRILTKNKDINFVFATGRHYIDAVYIKNIININAYMITSNGSRIYNLKNEIIRSHYFDQNIAYELSKIVYYDSNIVTNIFQNDNWLINKKNSYYENNIIKQSGLTGKIYRLENLATDNIYKIYYTSNDYYTLINLENKLNNIWNNKINVSFSLPTCLEVMPEGVSKGSAICYLIKKLGYKLKDCISFGDGMNDKEMLSITGKGCIMQNAVQRLKDELSHLEIIGRNTEDAVPNYLQSIYLNKINIEKK